MNSLTLALRWDGTLVADSSSPEFAPGSLFALLNITQARDTKFLFLTSSPLSAQEEALRSVLSSQGVSNEVLVVASELPSKDSVQFDVLISSRESDILAARSLGARAIKVAGEETSENSDGSLRSWSELSTQLVLPARKASRTRKTSETSIELSLNLDGRGESQIQTGLHFFDHMLDQLARHGGVDLHVKVDGDLEVDEHHTIEDLAIVLGEAVSEALGEKRGISRYGFLLPMDDCLATVAIDFSGRSWLVWDAEFKREKIGDMPCEMFMHFFKSFSDAARCNLNIKAEGQNEHHKIESIFKAWARAIRMAIERDSANMQVPSTKGTL